MPDSYEDLNGLDSGDPKDGAQVASNGYTNLENYLNGLVKDITEGCLEGGEVLGNKLFLNQGGSEVEYELSHATSDGAWGFNDGFSISTSKGYASGSSCGMTGIKYSRNTTFTINIPDGITIGKVKIQGYSNVDNEDAYLGELGGNAYGSNEYVFPSRSTGTYATHTITLDQPAKKTLTFTPKGQQVVWIITLYSPVQTGIEGVKADSEEQPAAIFTLDGRRISQADAAARKGLYIINGKKQLK